MHLTPVFYDTFMGIVLSVMSPYSLEIPLRERFQEVVGVQLGNCACRQYFVVGRTE